MIVRHGERGRGVPEVRLHRSRTLTAADITTLHRLPVTSPARALLDFADVAEPRELELALDEGLATRRVSRTKVREVLQRAGAGRRGAPVLAELVTHRRPSSITRSEGEERLRSMILGCRHIPAPVMQAALHGFSADFYWPQAAYVVEFDGYDWHSTRSAWKRDRRKDRVLDAEGAIKVDRFDWEEINRQALAVVARIASQVAARSAVHAAKPRSRAQHAA